MYLAHVLRWPYHVCHGVWHGMLGVGATECDAKLSLWGPISSGRDLRNLWADFLFIDLIIITFV